MSLEQKAIHIEEAQANLVSQFQDKPILKALLASFVEQIQQLENVFFELLDLRYLTSGRRTRSQPAFGMQLDRIGSIVGEERQRRTDDAYRLAIDARIILNRTNGTPEDIIRLIRALVGDKEVEIIESFPAHFDAIVNDPIDVDPFRVSTFVQSAKPAGVRGIFQWHQTNKPFGFEGDPEAFGFDDGKDRRKSGEFAGAADF